MHTKLVVLMLLGLPMLLVRRSGVTRHWSQMTERGGVWGLRISVVAYRLLGRRGCIAVLLPVIIFIGGSFKKIKFSTNLSTA